MDPGFRRDDVIQPGLLRARTHPIRYASRARSRAHPTQAMRTSGTAVASLVFGILSWCIMPFIGAILAIILGHSARGEIRRAPPGTIDGDGMALAGLILGYAHLIIVVGFLFIVFAFLGGLAFFAHFH
jgi:thiol:disulfide interchange protein